MSKPPIITMLKRGMEKEGKPASTIRTAESDANVILQALVLQFDEGSLPDAIENGFSRTSNYTSTFRRLRALAEVR
jgi:hypothetical protein